jgi:hypothetical protein
MIRIDFVPVKIEGQGCRCSQCVLVNNSAKFCGSQPRRFWADFLFFIFGLFQGRLPRRFSR